MRKMITAGSLGCNRRATPIAIIAMSLLATPSVFAQAQTLEQQQKAFKVVADFADRYCKAPPTGGSSNKIELNATLQADFASIVKKLLNLGVLGAAKFEHTSYTGVLPQDAAKLYTDYNSCRNTIWTDLKLSFQVVEPKYAPVDNTTWRGTAQLHGDSHLANLTLRLFVNGDILVGTIHQDEDRNPELIENVKFENGVLSYDQGTYGKPENHAELVLDKNEGLLTGHSFPRTDLQHSNYDMSFKKIDSTCRCH